MVFSASQPKESQDIASNIFPLFLGDIVGPSGCTAIRENLENQIKINKITKMYKFDII